MYEFVDQRVTSLDHGSRFLIWSMRSWVKALTERRCPPSAIGPAFAKRGMIAALPHFHTAMRLLNRDGLDTFRVAPLDCHHVAEDEALLLSLVRALRDDQPDSVRKTVELMVTEDAVVPLLAAFTAIAIQLAEKGIFPEASCPRLPHGEARS